MESTNQPTVKAFVINLKRSPHRRRQIEAQLQTLGIEYEIVDATDGQLLSQEDVKKIYDSIESLKYISKPLTLGEIACADSQLRVYEKIITQNLSHALVLEDDVILDERILEIFEEKFLSEKKYDWLQIDYPPVGWIFFKNWIAGGIIFSRENPLFAFYAIIKLPYISTLCVYEWLREKRCGKKPRIVTFARPLYLASAYIITNKGARTLVSFGRPIRFAADMLPNKARILTTFKMKAVCPPLAQQDKKFDSDIGIR